MSKALSDERQHVIDAAQKYKADAEFLWLSLLKPYCNTLAQSDRAFIVALCLEHKCGVMFADLASNLLMLERHELNEVEFADFEAKFIASATALFTAARQTFFDLQKHFKESHPTVYERMPDALNQLRGIIEFLDGNLGNAKELRQIRANRLTPVEIPMSPIAPPATANKISIPDDFGIPETETEADFTLTQVIKIARKWGIGPGDKAIRNRATMFFERNQSGAKYDENGKRYLFTREEAISFLEDLKRTPR